MAGYKEINYRAMKLLPRGGLLATCSCSHFATEEKFTAMLRQAARDWRRLTALSLVTQSGSSSVPAVVKKLGAVRSFSEYMMTYGGKPFPCQVFLFWGKFTSGKNF